METTTDAPSFARSRRQRPAADPALIWAPLADLTEAAATAAESGTVAITRGFDRNSRLRAKALRDLLAEREVPAIEITPAPGSDRLVDGVPVAVVVNLIGAGSWQPYRLAAQLKVEILTPKPGEHADEAATRDVIAMVGESGNRGVALSHIAVRAETPAEATLTLTYDGSEHTVAGGWVSATVQGTELQVQFGGRELTEQSLRTGELRVETSDALHRLVRDELPIADFEGSVTFTAEDSGLRVRPV